MPHNTISLTVEGQPGEDIQIWYRGDRDADDPAPIVFTGKLDETGPVTVSVPRAYLLVGRPERQDGTPVSWGAETDSDKTVKLTSWRKAGED